MPAGQAARAKNMIRSLSLPGLVADGLLSCERNTAQHDLINTGKFNVLAHPQGPYDIVLSIEEHRLVLRIRNTDGHDLPMLVLSLKPYRRVIEDYFLIIASYEEARRNGVLQKLETIDMARRGLHNEGAELLRERLADKIDMDFETARRFFTLICALHRNHVKLA